MGFIIIIITTTSNSGAVLVYGFLIPSPETSGIPIINTRIVSSLSIPPCTAIDLTALAWPALTTGLE